MVRTQISLPEELHRRVTDAARERGQSMSSLIREMLDRELRSGNDAALLLQAAERMRHRAGRADLATNHDEYPAEDGRW